MEQKNKKIKEIFTLQSENKIRINQSTPRERIKKLQKIKEWIASQAASPAGAAYLTGASP